ncbi:hypothetical protein SAMN05216475_2975 [Pseudomonas synxantha]|nr:hypothetical protein SAMN05216475_2975 [Pseudomonas synxantha]
MARNGYQLLDARVLATGSRQRIQPRRYFIVRRPMTASLFMGERIRTRWFP